MHFCMHVACERHVNDVVDTLSYASPDDSPL
jgi:hypothetical protein